MLSRLSALLLLAGCALAISLTPLAADEPPKAKEKKEKGQPNRLIKSSSPYLLQHAHNPVDWYPWGPDAFAKARKENKLIFLSIGYSACHWCHVMERESFSDPEIAKIMNMHFVCIKVDREERPDIDEVYMTALQVMGDQGGWPLNFILTPEGKPIVGFTYFPPKDKKVGDDTIPGFKTVLERVIEFDKKRDEMLKHADEVAKATADVLEGNRVVALVTLNRDLVIAGAESFDIDPEHGGNGRKATGFKGTKFPRPPVWGFLLARAYKANDAVLKKQVALTLQKMAEGGIYDHLGGGFHRYSTERTWTVPHFEKMLYDNAQLVELYSEAFARDPRPEYKRVVTETLEFVKREMTSPDGAFYSAIDADSNEKEGEFYVWTTDELKKVLGTDADIALVKTVYGVGAPNFEDKFHILRLPRPLADIAKEQKLTEAELLAKLEPLKKKLFDHRAKRERPFLDTKVIASWNGQMIAGYARAGHVFKNKEWTEAASKAADFVLTKMRDKDGRLLRIHAAIPGEKPRAAGTAFLDDYANVIHGLLTLHDATGEKRWLDAAKELTDLAIKWYGDDKRGGFFFTPTDGEKLFARMRDSYDGVQPSGNSQMALDLARLWRKTKDDTYRDLCVMSVKAFALTLKSNPASMPAMLHALDELLDAGYDPDTKPGDPPAPKNPKESSEVVTAKLALAGPNAGARAFTLTLTVADPWHLYANPVGSEGLLESQTDVDVRVGGKRVEAKVVYPKGKELTDSSGAKYAIYAGTVTITGSVPAEGEIEVRVRIVACKEGKCLLPSELRVKP